MLIKIIIHQFTISLKYEYTWYNYTNTLKTQPPSQASTFSSMVLPQRAYCYHRQLEAHHRTLKYVDIKYLRKPIT